jgi:hypothetical protein
MVARLDPLPATAAILHLAARRRAALGLPVGGEAEQPHRRPPTPIGEEIARQQRCEGCGVRIAIIVGPPPAALGARAAWRLEQLCEEGLGSGYQHARRLTVDCIAPPL